MGAEQSTGGSLRSHLTTVWEQTGVKPEELEESEYPDAIGHVWKWFLDLHKTRSSGINGPDCISYREIKAWSELTGVEPSPFEVGCLTALDGVWMQSQGAK